MKTTKHIWTLAAAVLLGVAMTGCSDEHLTEIVMPQEEETTDTTDAVVTLLKSIPGVSEINKQVSFDGTRTAYYFFFEQAVDHHNPVKGTFRQHCSLQYAAQDAPVVLHTQGYEMADSIDRLRPLALTYYLHANVLEVEHRYFNQSMPEAREHIGYNYLWTEQAAADLHAVVQAFRQYAFPTNKWVATGTSKGGITTTLYAYYSDRNGWNDIDLFLPFCAPFLQGTPESCADTHTVEYLIENCGSGYAAGTVEAEAYRRLRAYPKLLVDNEHFRKTCIDMLTDMNPEMYRQVLAAMNDGEPRMLDTVERNMTARLVDYFYECLFEKFSYVLFSDWASQVPDPERAVAPGATDEEVSEAAEFVFMDSKALVEKLSSKEGVNHRAAFSYNELLRLANNPDESFAYYVQGSRELGLSRLAAPALQGCSFLTPDEVCSVCSVFDEAEKYGTFYNQWDGGRLMTAVRQWAVTQTTTPIVFVYMANDPWTGGAIDEPTGMSQRIVSAGGMHHDEFLNLSIYTQEASTAIQAAIDERLKR